MRPGARIGAHALLAVTTAIIAALIVAPAASAAGLHTAGPSTPLALLGPVGDLFGKLVGAGLGAIDWTVELASKFLINTIGGFVKALIPDEWKDQALAVMKWIVGVPNYSAQVTTPGGSRAYGFSGLNQLRDVMLWLGLALLPLTLTVAVGTRTFGQGEHPAVPLFRVGVLAVLMLSYTWLWSNGAALANQFSASILGTPRVADGIENLFSFLVTGAGVGGMPLIGLILMGVCGVYLLLMIFTKIVVLLVGAIVYVIGPLILGVSPTERGSALASAWLSMVAAVLILPIVWTIVFAVAAVLMFDAGDPNAAAIVGGSSSIGKVFGGLLLGMAGVAGFWLNIKITKASASILTSQVSALLTTATAGGGGGGGGARLSGPSAVRTVQDFRRTMASAGGGASGGMRGIPLAAAALSTGGTAAAFAGRSAAAGRGAAAATADTAAPGTSGPRASMVATRLARGGRAPWAHGAQDTAGTAATGAPSTASAAATRQIDPVDDPAARPPTGGAPASQNSRTGGDSPDGAPRTERAAAATADPSRSADAVVPPTPSSSPPATPSDRTAGSDRSTATPGAASRAAAQRPGNAPSAPGIAGAGTATPAGAPTQGTRRHGPTDGPSPSTRPSSTRPATPSNGGPSTAPTSGSPAAGAAPAKPASAGATERKAPPSAPPPTPRTGRNAPGPTPRPSRSATPPAPKAPTDKPARRRRKAPAPRDPFGREIPPKQPPRRKDR